MESQRLDMLRTAGGSTVRLVRYSPGTRQRRHAHDHASVTLVLRGSLLERSSASEQRASALSVVAKRPGYEHEDAFGPRGATTLQVELPASGTGDSIAAAEPGGACWFHAGPGCRAMLRLLACVRPDLAPSGPGEDPDDLLAEALALLGPQGRSDRSPPPWLGAACESLAGNSVPVRILAERAGVHPVHLARAFRAHVGVSPTAFRARMRVHRAAHRLAGAEGTLVDVALDAGYCDQPHMNREFHAAAGITPHQLRRMAAGLAG